MVSNTAEIGIFGGTGIYDSELLQDSKEITIETPYGKTSDTITIGEFKGKKIAFMPRHGKKHSIPPHMINIVQMFGPSRNWELQGLFHPRLLEA